MTCTELIEKQGPTCTGVAPDALPGCATYVRVWGVGVMTDMHNVHNDDVKCGHKKQASSNRGKVSLTSGLCLRVLCVKAD